MTWLAIRAVDAVATGVIRLHPANVSTTWTRAGCRLRRACSRALRGSVFLWLDYRVALAPLRAELERVCKADRDWDGRVAILQVVETSERAIQVRVLVSSADAPRGWDLRCRVREALIDYLQRRDPDSLPRLRADIRERGRAAALRREDVAAAGA